jgi:hypothetical protein
VTATRRARAPARPTSALAARLFGPQAPRHDARHDIDSMESRDRRRVARRLRRRRFEQHDGRRQRLERRRHRDGRTPTTSTSDAPTGAAESSSTGAATVTETEGDTTTTGDTTSDITTSDITTTDSTTTDSTTDTTGGVEPTCDAGEWTCVAVEPGAPYGEHVFEVPAAQNWVNTGLYLEAGQKATISVEGAWSVGPDDGEPISHGPCLIADFVARIGLHYEEVEMTCVDGQAEVTADKDGILYVGALPSDDLGETYETRREATGVKTATITSDGATVPYIAVADAADYPYDQVVAPWVEIAGEHIIVTLPRDVAAMDAAQLADALARLDTFYDLHHELRGALPQHGQRIRFFPDANVAQFAYMLAGNPVRMDPILVDAGSPDRISLAGEPGVDVWGFAHELGHDFTLIDGLWWYQEKTLESWPNVFTVHAFEELGLPMHEDYVPCPGSQPVDYAAWDAWDGLCFLMQFQYDHGWQHHVDFFAALNTTSADQVPFGPEAWHFVHDVFEDVSNSDETPTFTAWGVPNPG